MKNLIIFLSILASLLSPMSAYQQRHVNLIIQQSEQAGIIINATGADLSGCGTLLRQLQAPGIQLCNAMFAPCKLNDYSAYNLYQVCVANQISDLTGVNFSGGNLSYANFSYANLTHANLSKTNATSACFAHANLTGADISGMQLNATNFCMATMPDGQVCGSGATWTGQGLTIDCGSGQ